ncbi:MAG: helix-turn-helix domain-containing protein [Opitutus sp.]|nr:helix-turn-helix domain-containing protein [Opitutus sp.]
MRPPLAEPGLTWEEEQESITAWISTLPTPVSIVVAHDTQGVPLLDGCRRAAGMSRRALEKKFFERIGRTPLEEVLEVRFRRVRQLRLETDYVLPQIAELAGFQYREYMVRFCMKRTGMTPGEFRRKKRFASKSGAGRPTRLPSRAAPRSRSAVPRRAP